MAIIATRGNRDAGYGEPIGRDTVRTRQAKTGVVPRPGPHGGDGHRIASALGLDPSSILDLSHTMNPFFTEARTIVSRHLEAVDRYPDAGEATDMLAQAVGVDPSRVLITNGGSAAVAAVAAEIGGRVLSEPEFSLHPRHASGPTWRSDPHSPTGRLAAPDMVANVWDEAFYPLATGRWSAHRDGVVVGSLTKVFHCPGLRLGYVIADDVERYAAYQPQWAVSSLALAALPDLLAAADLTLWSAAIAKARQDLVDVFEQRGFAVDAAEAPWVLVDAPGLRDRLAPQGVVVRDCQSFGLPEMMRVSVTDDEGLRRLERALDAR